MASTMKEYRTCSTSWDYTHTVYATFHPGSKPDEQQKKMNAYPNSSSTMTCVWWRNPQPSTNSKQGESNEGRRKRERKNSIQLNKRPPYPSLHRLRRGCTSPSPSHVGLNPQGGIAPAKGGGGPPLAHGPRGSPSPSHNGPFMAHVPFNSFLIFLIIF